MQILITGACGVTPRAIARSLRLSERFRNATLVGTDRGGNWYGFYEGLYDRVYRVSDPSDPQYVELMTGICREEQIDVAIISPEQEVIFWSDRTFPAPTLLPPPKIANVAVSKRRLYEALQGSELIPRNGIVARDDLLARRGLDFAQGPVWLRDFSDASSSGMGAIKITDADQARAWAYLNPAIAEYMVAEYLPGRNLACCLLFDQGELLKVGCYERLEYFGGQLIVSGVSGNISRGRLVRDSALVAAAERAVRLIADHQEERLQGLFTIDLREAASGAPKVTEINVRHTAATSAMAAGGANMAEAQILASLGRRKEIDLETTCSGDSVILRDIDGPPLLLANSPEVDLGQFISRDQAAATARAT